MYKLHRRTLQRRECSLLHLPVGIQFFTAVRGKKTRCAVLPSKSQLLVQRLVACHSNHCTIMCGNRRGPRAKHFASSTNTMANAFKLINTETFLLVRTALLFSVCEILMQRKSNTMEPRDALENFWGEVVIFIPAQTHADHC